QVRGKLRERREPLVGMDLLRAREEGLFALGNVRIGDAAVHRADRRAGFLVVEADALGAEHGIDDEDVLALADGLVGALRLASAAVDALLGDHRRHEESFITRCAQPIQTVLVLVNSRIPTWESSRP